jgi:DNA-binding transcriptional ArsR family regulator
MLNLMVEYPEARLTRTFAALADPTRRAILARLRLGSLTVGELAEPFPISLNAVSKHLKQLERARLVRREVKGRTHHLFLEAEPIGEAEEWTARYREFWERRLDALEAFVTTRHQAAARSRGERRR